MKSALLLAACVLVSLSMHVAADAAETDFKLGDQYAIGVHSQRAGGTFTGTLVQANDRWLALKKADQADRVQGNQRLIALPVIGRWFEKLTPVTVDVITWIPREVAKVESHQAATGQPPVEPIADAAPPIGSVCEIVTQQGQREGKLKSAAGSQLTASVKKGAKEVDVKFERQNILCVICFSNPKPIKTAASAPSGKAPPR